MSKLVELINGRTRPEYLFDDIRPAAPRNRLAEILGEAQEVGARNSKGGQDTELAHISPEEAGLLQLLGGSGRIDHQTGLPHFDLDTSDTVGLADNYLNSKAGGVGLADTYLRFRGGGVADSYLRSKLNADLIRGIGERNSKDGQDSVLAHINTDEAALLEALGGSGRTDPVTGLRHFDDNGDSGDDGDGGDSWGGGDNTSSVGPGGDNTNSENSFDNGSMSASGAFGGPAGGDFSSFSGGFDNADPNNGGSAWGNPSGGLNAENTFDTGDMAISMGQGRDGSWDQGAYNEQGGDLGTSGRGGNVGGVNGPVGGLGVGGFGPGGLDDAHNSWTADPGAWNGAYNNQPGLDGPIDGDTFANWASREGIYSQPGAGRSGALDFAGTNFGDPHSLEANPFQTFITQHGLQEVMDYGVPVAATLLGGPVWGAVAGLGLNAAKGDNITAQGLSTLGGLAGGPLGAATGSVLGNVIEGHPVNAINTALNTALNYAGANFGNFANHSIGNKGSITNQLVSMAGNQAQNYVTNYAANQINDAFENGLGTQNSGALTSEGHEIGGGDAATAYAAYEPSPDISFDVADSPTFGVMRGGGGGGTDDVFDPTDFMGSKKKSRYRRPNSLVALLEGQDVV